MGKQQKRQKNMLNFTIRMRTAKSRLSEISGTNDWVSSTDEFRRGGGEKQRELITFLNVLMVLPL